MIDWTKAVYIACAGFSLVFVVLGILAFSIWVIGKIIVGLEKGG